jgi:hypothetical protein
MENTPKAATLADAQGRCKVQSLMQNAIERRRAFALCAKENDPRERDGKHVPGAERDGAALGTP